MRIGPVWRAEHPQHGAGVHPGRRGRAERAVQRRGGRAVRSGASALQRLGSADVTHAPRWRKDSAGGPAAARGATLSLPPAGPSAAGGGGNWRQASLSM